MNTLIVEDDPVSQELLLQYLQGQGETDIAEDGEKAVVSFCEAWGRRRPFDLVCLDIMLPRLDGQEVLKRIRSFEDEMGVGGLAACKVIMVTALRDAESVLTAFRGQCEGYLTKPISKEKLYREIESLGLTLK